MRYPVFTCLSMLFFLTAGCIVSPQAPKPLPKELLLPSYEQLIPGGTDTAGLTPSTAPSIPSGTGLLTTLSQQYGIRLSLEETAQLRTLLEIQPNGRWSRSQNQSAEENLIANFKRFGPLFEPSLDNAEEYRLKAVTFAEKAKIPYYFDTTFYAGNKRMLICKWNQETGEFVVIQADGTLVNYLITQAIQPPRYLKVEL